MTTNSFVFSNVYIIKIRQWFTVLLAGDFAFILVMSLHTLMML